MERTEIIKTIIELHNFFTVELKKYMSQEIKIDDLWDINLLALKPDRFYLVESLHEKSWDSEKDIKTYEVETQVRYGLRSKEASEYGSKHRAFYDRYLNTISIENSYFTNPQAYKDRILKEFTRKDT